MTNHSRVLLLLFFSVAPALRPHDIITTKLTYTRDVSRIFVHRCAGCHRSSATIPLTNYEQVRPWAVSIKEQVLSRAMPPWGAVKGFGQFKPDEALTQEEMMIIAAWVIGGAPKGDLSLLPPSPKDLVVRAPPNTARLRIFTGATLKNRLQLVAITPDVKSLVDSARITASLPDGSVEPMLWLYRYDGHNRRTYYFRNVLDLPAGTSIQSTAPLKLDLDTVIQPSPAK